MSVVTATRYNAMQTKIAAVLGTGSGDKGYGQSVTSVPLSVGDKVQATHLQALFTDINKCILHQTGSATSNISKKGWIQFETEATTAETNRLNNSSGNFTAADKLTIQRTSAWGGSPDTINATFTVVFASADIKRNYFNAGGEIRITLALTGGSGSKGTSWTNLFTAEGTVKFGRTATSRTGSAGDTTSIGNVDMTGTHQQIFQHDVGSGVYGENDFNITARDNNTTPLEFIITVNDDDSGDQTGTGGPVDENVGGTLTATIAEFRPTNASAVTLASPTFTTTDGFQ